MSHSEFSYAISRLAREHLHLLERSCQKWLHHPSLWLSGQDGCQLSSDCHEVLQTSPAVRSMETACEGAVLLTHCLKAQWEGRWLSGSQIQPGHPSGHTTEIPSLPFEPPAPPRALVRSSPSAAGAAPLPGQPGPTACSKEKHQVCSEPSCWSQLYQARSHFSVCSGHFSPPPDD